MNNKEENITFSEFGIALSLAIASLFLWNSIILLPIKLMTVFFHELSHGIVAILTGGRIIGISLNINEGGVCSHIGGIPILVASAGYLGSLLWGSGILLASLKKGFNKRICQAIAVFFIVVTGLWVRDIQAIAITVTIAVSLLYISANLKEKYCSIFLKYISLISCFYVVFDIKNDLLDRTVPLSDAYQISKSIFPSFMVAPGSYIIGILWMAVAIFILWKAIKYALKSK